MSDRVNCPAHCEPQALVRVPHLLTHVSHMLVGLRREPPSTQTPRRSRTCLMISWWHALTRTTSCLSGRTRRLYARICARCVVWCEHCGPAMVVCGMLVRCVKGVCLWLCSLQMLGGGYPDTYLGARDVGAGSPAGGQGGQVCVGAGLQTRAMECHGHVACCCVNDMLLLTACHGCRPWD